MYLVPYIDYAVCSSSRLRLISEHVPPAALHMAMELAAAKFDKKTPKTLPEMVPPYLRDLLPVFDKGTASQLPKHTEYNHEINLKLGFDSMKIQVYLLSPLQWKELDKFVTENESKGYI